MVMRTVTMCVTLALGIPLWCSTAFAEPVWINGIAYRESGLTESVNVSFTTPDGGVSSETYSGYVEARISGSGCSNSSALNDAFWLYTNFAGNPVSPHIDSTFPNCYQLAFDVKAITAFPPLNQLASQRIVYDGDSQNEVVSWPYLPAYQTTHEYRIVLDTRTTTAKQLHFGVADGNFNDNSGSYSVLITQLTPVPEPSALILLGIGAFGLLAYDWRRRK
jgi:hypothetical protein